MSSDEVGEGERGWEDEGVKSKLAQDTSESKYESGTDTEVREAV